MRLFERPGGCAKTGLRTRRLARLRTGPVCARGPLRGRRGWCRPLGRKREGEWGEDEAWPTLGEADIYRHGTRPIEVTIAGGCFRVLRIGHIVRRSALSARCGIGG